MVGIFCMKFVREIGTFNEKILSSDGEEYSVKIITNNSNGYLHGVKIILEWKKRLNLFIRVKTYNVSSSGYSFHRTLFVNNGTNTSVNVSSSVFSENEVLFISIVKCKDISNCVVNMPSLGSNESTVGPTVKRKKMGPEVGKELEGLSRDMKKILQTSNLSDVILSDGTKEIRAHKFVLSARSPVFAKMFEHEMIEKIKNVITIEDISIDVLKVLLDFMYTGVVEIKDMKMAINLYVAADKYDIKDLKEICSRMLKTVDLDNALKVIILADLYEDKPLKQAVLNFIHKNYSYVKVLKEWKDILTENKTLAIEILSSVVDNII